MDPGTPFAWPDGARVALSLSFDDARCSQLRRALPILAEHDLRATFYVLPGGVSKRNEEWRGCAAEGHEIGNHSATHPCSGNFFFARHRAIEDLDLADIEADILDANAAIEEGLGLTPRSFAYPCGHTTVGRGTEARSYVPVVARHFLVGRGYNHESHAHPQHCDLAHVPARNLDGASFEQVRGWLETAAHDGGWLVLAGHSVSATGGQAVLPDTLERLCRHARDPESGVWCETVARVGEHLAAAGAQK